MYCRRSVQFPLAAGCPWPWAGSEFAGLLTALHFLCSPSSGGHRWIGGIGVICKPWLLTEDERLIFGLVTFSVILP